MEVLFLDRFLHFIVNKQSRNSDAAFKRLLIELPKYTKSYDFLITENIDQLERLLFQLKSTINPNDIIVVVGGDGSLNQFVTFYIEFQFKNYIGYIPAGSGNDFARANDIPTNTKKAIQHLFTIKEKKDLSIIHATQEKTQHYAVNSIGVGIDGLISHLVNSKKHKEKLGPLSYLAGILSGFINQKKFALTLIVDDGVYKFKNTQLGLVANNPSFGGGIYIIPEANGKDDELDILIADDISIRDLVSIISKIKTNKTHLSHPKLYSFKSKKVKIRVHSDQYAQKDGEVFHGEEFNYSFDTVKLCFWI